MSITVESTYYKDKLAGVLVRCPYRLNARIKSIPSHRWIHAKRAWHFPLDVAILERIEALGTILPADVQAWVDRQRAAKAAALALKDQEDTDLQVPFAEKLWGFQRVGAKFLVQVGRALLGDDMGLGKTLQAITACEELKARRVLIVCPNTLKGNWAEEIHKWVPNRNVTVLSGPAVKKARLIQEFKEGYLVVNYETVRWSYEKTTIDGKSKRVKKPGRHIIDELLGIAWDVLIVDEAHNIRNRKVNQTEGVKALASVIEYTFLLTGTPIMNRVDDLWSLLHVLYPKQYSSFWSFVQKHATAYPGRFGWVIDGTPTQPEALRREMAPFFLRREKTEVFPDMPPVVRQTVWVDLEADQRRIYDEIEEFFMTVVDEDTTVITPGILAQITRCKQVAISPALIGGKREGAKLDAFMDIVHGTDRKILVFSQFAEAIKLVSEMLTEANIGHVVLTGKTPDGTRDQLRHKFQTDPSIRLFLATTTAGGVGLTLTAASLVVFLDKHWTPSVNQQAIDRTRPHLQKESVQVIELLARNSIDEMVEDVLAGKVTIIEAVIAKRKKLLSIGT